MEPQTLTVTLKFKTEHKPGTQSHLAQVAKSYFKGKGITLSDDLTIEI